MKAKEFSVMRTLCAPRNMHESCSHKLTRQEIDEVALDLQFKGWVAPLRSGRFEATRLGREEFNKVFHQYDR